MGKASQRQLLEMPKIQKLDARPILNSRGEWTIEVALKLTNGQTVKSSIPQGASRGRAETVYVRPEKAIKNIRHIIQPALKGKNPSLQRKIDELLINLDGRKNKSRLGGNTILGVSLACCRAAAQAQEIPLWKHLKKISNLRGTPEMPRLFINVINGGLHAHNNLDFQEYLIIPKSRNIKNSTTTGIKIYKALKQYLERNFGPGRTGVGDEGGFAPKFKNNLEPFEILAKIISRLGLKNRINLGMDAAATNIKIPAKKLFSIYNKLMQNFNLYYLEDPFRENDFENFARLNQKIGKNTFVCADDLTTTNLERMKKACEKGSINSIIIKPNQIGTLSETLAAIAQAKKWGWKVVVSHRSGETNDDFIADLAYAVGAFGIKLGAPARGERIAKYNRLLEIS